jgi:hypothetical protein
MGRTACTEPQCLYSRAIPLLPLWAVLPVQSLSACTVQVYLYSPIGRTACTEPQCLYSTAMPLLPYWTYSLYKASVPVQYSYTSTPPFGRSACTVPQCLYSTAIPLLSLWAVRPVQSLSALQGCSLPLPLHICLYEKYLSVSKPE